MAELKLPVYALQTGDVTNGTRETVLSVSAGVRTPRGKMEIVLEKNGRMRLTIWGRHTLVSVTRGA
jgi:hypothetical protein